MNTVRYIVTYNPELLSFSVDYEKYEEAEEYEEGPSGEGGESQSWYDSYQGMVRLDYWHSGSEMNLLLRNKDQILKELKQGQFGIYQMRDIESVEVWMNPEMKPYVE